MKWLALLVLLSGLSGCALSAASSAAPPAPSRGSLAATIDLSISVADSETDEPLEVDTVWLDDDVAYRHVSFFVLLIPGDFEPAQDGHLIRINAVGYEQWQTRIRLRTRTDRSLTLPVHMHRRQPRALRVME